MEKILGWEKPKGGHKIFKNEGGNSTFQAEFRDREGRK